MGNALSVACIFTGIWVPAHVTSSLCSARPGWVTTWDLDETSDPDRLCFLPAHDFWDFRYRSIPISTTPAQDAAGVLRRKEGSYTVSYMPESVARTSMADRLEGLHRGEPPRFATRRRLEHEGLVLPDHILHEYLPTRKPRKK